MEHLFRACLKHRKAVIVVFIIAAFIAGVCIPSVKVNGDFSSYLPSDTSSTKSLNKMEEVYGSDLTNVRVFVEGISLADAQSYVDELSKMDGVVSTSWLGDYVDVNKPLEMQSDSTVSEWHDGTGYLFQVAMTEPYEQASFDTMRADAESYDGVTKVSIDGNAAAQAATLAVVSTDMVKIMLTVVLAVLLVILLTTTSFIHPIIMLITIGIAVVINMGTNLIQGEISEVTQLVAAVLQLAVSMDYAIVLLANVSKTQRAVDDPFEAMVLAMTKSFPVVLSSAAVTFFGFLSLVFMKFLIGQDMGIALAKGIVASFLCVTFLMPCLLYVWRRGIARFTHKSIIPSFNKFANVCRKAAVPAAIIVCLIAVPAYLAQQRGEFTYGASSTIAKGSQYDLEHTYIDDVFGESQSWVIMVPEGQWASEQALVDDLQSLPTTRSVLSWSTVASPELPYQMASESTSSQLINGGYSRIVLSSDVAEEGDQTFALVEQVRELCQQYYGDSTYLCGTSVSCYDIMDVASSDSLRSKLISAIAIGLVLLVMFRSLSIPLILLLTIELAIWINLSFPYLLGQVNSYTGYLVIDAVQLGAAVDYSIIYTHEYLRERRSLPAERAAHESIKNAGVPIVMSSTILILATLGIYLVASVPVITQLGMLIFRGTIISVIMIFLFMPSLFVAGDWIVKHTTLNLHFLEPKKENDNAK